MKKSPCFCGHDCARCVTRLATVRGDEQLRMKARAFYQHTFGLDLPLHQLHCRGGRSQEVFCLARTCPFASCCRTKQLHACSDCADYPCATLSDYLQKYVNQCNQIPPSAQDGT